MTMWRYIKERYWPPDGFEKLETENGRAGSQVTDSRRSRL